MSMSTPYILRQDLPDYGIMPHFYVENGVIQNVTCSIIKMIEDDSGYVSVYLLDELYEQSSINEQPNLLHDAKIILKRLLPDRKIEPRLDHDEIVLFSKEN